MSNRNYRGRTQKMYLLNVECSDNQWNMSVQGLTSQYNIKVGKDIVECTCPDFTNRKNICKHLYFIFSQVAQYQEGDLILANIESSGGQETNNIKLNDTVFTGLSNKLTARLKKRMEVMQPTENPTIIPEDDSECVICFEQIEKDDKLFQCVKQCKKFCHDACIQIWLARGQNTCPYCRTVIDDKKETAKYDPLDKFIGLKLSSSPPQTENTVFINDFLSDNSSSLKVSHMDLKKITGGDSIYTKVIV